MENKSTISGGTSVLTTTTLTQLDVEIVFHRARLFKSLVEDGVPINIAQGRVMALLFYEPSTRTSCSFQAAMQRLGGTCIVVDNPITSSIAKGETLEDTAKTLASYADVLVIRHPQVGSVAQAAKAVHIPVLNAGDGTGEHPTQALLDMFTMEEETKTDLTQGLNVVFVGDLKNGRTVHSLAVALSKYPNMELHYVSPKGLEVPTYVQQLVAENGKHTSREHHAKGKEKAKKTDATTTAATAATAVEENVPQVVQQYSHTSLSTCLYNADILYVTRIQKERFASDEEYQAVQADSSFRISKATLDKFHARKDIRILHPLPRVDELSTDVRHIVQHYSHRLFFCLPSCHNQRALWWMNRLPPLRPFLRMCYTYRHSHPPTPLISLPVYPSYSSPFSLPFSPSSPSPSCPQLDSDDRAAYFRQMRNGMFVRMAIVSMVLGLSIKSLSS